VLWGRGTANEEIVLGYHRSPIDLLRLFVPFDGISKVLRR
jgi:hypothetical protein